MDDQMPEVDYTDEELAEVRELLRNHLPENMPEEVQQRLDDVLAAEVARREDENARREDHARVSDLKAPRGTFGQHPEFDRTWEPRENRVR